MTQFNKLLVFQLDAQRYALPLGVVERVLRAAEITPLPKAPSIVMGVLDVGGDVLPVLNVRRRFGLPEREIRPEDHFLVAKSGGRTVALTIDEPCGLEEFAPEAFVPDSHFSHGLDHLTGVGRLANGLVLIHDLHRFLSQEEATALDRMMQGEGRDD
jgi:purine-binding chemotaxis protein CheW